MNDKIIKHSRTSFGLTFRNLRNEKGLTQNQVADLCGVTHATINKVEQGKSGYLIDLLFKLSVILEFTINFEQKENVLPNRFLLQVSERTGYFIVTDTANKMVCMFESGKFNDTKKLTILNKNQFPNLATILRELGDWLGENHRDKV